MIMRTWKGTSFLWQSKITLDGASHARKNLSNRQVNARNGMNTWQTIRRLNRLFCGRRILSTNAKPPSGDFTMPVLCSLLYVYERLKMHLPSMFRRKMSHNTYYSLQNSQRHIKLQIWSQQIQAERRLKDLALHSKDRERVRKSSGKRGSQIMFESCTS